MRYLNGLNVTKDVASMTEEELLSIDIDSLSPEESEEVGDAFWYLYDYCGFKRRIAEYEAAEKNKVKFKN